MHHGTWCEFVPVCIEHCFGTENQTGTKSDLLVSNKKKPNRRTAGRGEQMEPWDSVHGHNTYCANPTLHPNPHTRKRKSGENGRTEELTLSSSKTPLRILSRISLVAVSNATSTFVPDFALASTNSRPSSLAHNSASSVGTWRGRGPDPVVG